MGARSVTDMTIGDDRARSVLLVEDNPDDVELTLRALARNRVANPVLVAHDGVEALDLLFGTSGDGATASTSMPALVLLDLRLPRVDGLQVLRRIRADARTKRIPVVILTSSREDADVVRGYDLGANSYVRKPVEFERFVDAVRELGLYWLVLNEPPPA